MALHQDPPPTAVEAALAQLARDARQRRLLLPDITARDRDVLIETRRRTLPAQRAA